MQFILHVGPHKTGTSYLQEAFGALRPQLAERGIVYPSVWGLRAHHLLFQQLQQVPNPALEAHFAELRGSALPVALISVEGLTTLPEQTVAYLRTLIGAGNQVRVVFYARSWADILPSHWKQEVKGGGTQTLPEYLFGRAVNPTGSFFVNFGIGLRRYSKVFGAEAISVVSYDAVMAAQRDLFQHFAASFLSWPDAPKPQVTGVNVSPNAAEIEVIRAVNGLDLIRRGGGPPDRRDAATMTEVYLRRARELTGPDLQKAMADNMGKALLNEGSATLAALHQQLFSEFGKGLVPPHPADFFFLPRRAEIPYVRRDYMLVPGVVEQLREIHRQLRARVAQRGAAAGRSAA